MPRLFSWEEEERLAVAERKRERGAGARPRPRETPADKATMETNDDGLVISPKTVRSGLEERLSALGEQFDSKTPIPEDGSGHFIVLSPGSVRIKRRGIRQRTQTEGASHRAPIRAWSRKSRANMVARFSSLDLSPMRDQAPKALAVMITLTYPNAWQEIVPTASHAKKHLQQFRKRYERKFGHPFFALWKCEFQRRGAVHFHLFCAAPTSLAEFRAWVAITWSEIVSPADPREREKHLHAGTAVDIAPGATIEDARLVAVYFSKHSSSKFGVKEYQNTPPAEWLEGTSVGRFWGYWNLKPVEIEARLSQEEAILMARVLRRWFRAQRFTKVERVCRINRRGTITFRRARRRSKRLNHSYGFIALRNAVAISEDLSRFLNIARKQREDDS